MPYQYIHSHCGGRISLWRMRCQKCKKQYNPLSFMFTNKIRPVYTESSKAPTKGDKIIAKRIPVVESLVKFLPNWPRWARILTAVVLVLIIIAIVWAVKG
jgi:hypothetical protein